MMAWISTIISKYTPGFLSLILRSEVATYGDAGIVYTQMLFIRGGIAYS
jgi:hypothetical protein